jgi:hypothetical protein
MNKLDVLDRFDYEIKLLENRLSNGDYGVSFSVNEVLEDTKTAKKLFIKKYDL